MGSKIEGEMYVSGLWTFKYPINVPAGSFGDNEIEDDAGIKANKLQHQYSKPYGQDAATDAVAEQRIVHAGYGSTGTLLEFKCGLITPPDTVIGSDGKSVTVDLLKNGVSILSAAVTLSSTAVSRTLYAGTLSSTSIAAGDVLEVKITLGAGVTGTAVKGVFANLVLREDAA